MKEKTPLRKTQARLSENLRVTYLGDSPKSPLLGERTALIMKCGPTRTQARGPNICLGHGEGNLSEQANLAFPPKCKIATSTHFRAAEDWLGQLVPP